MKKESFRQHQTIFKAGDQAGKVYLLARGSVGIFLPDNDSKEPNFLIPENEIFGEMGVIEGKLRMATARCMSSAKIMSISKEQFEKKSIRIRNICQILTARKTFSSGILFASKIGSRKSKSMSCQRWKE